MSILLEIADVASVRQSILAPQLSSLLSKYHCIVIGYVPPNSLHRVQPYHVRHLYPIVLLVIICGRGSASSHP
jgi:hypothetical protein